MKFSKKILIYLVAFFIILFVFKVVEAVRAGSLTPSAAPAATMHSLEDVYDHLVGTYDASGETANINGTILQQLKAIKNNFGM